MKALVKSTGIMGFTQISLLAVSIIRNKYLAVNIGPHGFGLFSLLQSFFQLGDIIAGAALATASVKYYAEYNSENDKAKIQEVFDFSFSSVFLLATLVTACFFIFYLYFKKTMLTPDVIFFHYALFAASYMSTILSTVFNSFLMGMKLVRSIALRQMMTSLFSLGSVVLLVYLFDLNGFFMNVLLASLFGLTVFWIETKKRVKVRLKIPKFHGDVSRKIMRFSTIDVFLGLINMGSVYLIRIIVVKFLSISYLGLYSAAVGLSGYLGILSNNARYHLFPSMSEKKGSVDKSRELNDYFRFDLLFSIFASVAAILVAPMLIKVFYSKAFADLGKVFYIFVLAQFLLGIQIGFMWTIVGMAQLKIHSLVTVISHTIVVLIPFLYLKKYGLLALGIGSIIACIQHIAINSFYLKKKHDIAMNSKNLKLLVLGIILILLSILLKDHALIIKLSFIALTGAVTAYLITASEWRMLYAFIEGRFRKNDHC